MLNSNTLTLLLKKMEDLGYIRRIRMATDERVVEISLTDLGKRPRASCGRIPGHLAENWNFGVGKSAKLRKLLDELIEMLKALPADETD